MLFYIKMEKLLKKIKSKDDFDKFCKSLVERINNGNSISDNPMMDGMIIGFILTTKVTKDFFLQRELGSLLDGTIQKLEHIVMWCSDNEDELCSILE